MNRTLHGAGAILGLVVGFTASGVAAADDATVELSDRFWRKAGRTSALDGEFAGRKGFLCAGAERCPRRRDLEALITAPLEEVRSSGTPGRVASALHAELARAVSEVCRAARCSPAAKDLAAHLKADRRASWKVRALSADQVDVTSGGLLTGWRAELANAEGRTLELFCGLAERTEDPSCLLDLKFGDRVYRYHSSAGAPSFAMLELITLGDGHGYLWMDPAMRALGGDLALPRPPSP